MITVNYKYKEISHQINPIGSFLIKSNTVAGSVIKASEQVNPLPVTFEGGLVTSTSIPTSDVHYNMLHTPVLSYINQLTTSPSNRFIDFGLILIDSFATLVIYNDYYDDITLQDIIIPPYLGVDIQGINIGDVIPSRGFLMFGVTALINKGNSLVEAPISFLFDAVRVEYSISIIRVSKSVLSLEPDSSSYTESITFKTNIFTTKTNVERRVSLMSRPKHTIQYKVSLQSNQAYSYYSSLIKEGLQSTVLQPVWSTRTFSTTPTTTSTFISCDTLDTLISVGDYITIINSNIVYTPIVAKVTLVATDGLYLDIPISADENSTIIQCKKVVLNTSTTLSRVHSDFGSVSIQAEEL